MTDNPLTALIRGAIYSTKARTKERNAALQAIRWRLATDDGTNRFVGLDEFGGALLVPAGHPAVQTFTGLDNETMKLRFFTHLLRTPLQIVVVTE